jgi:GalNAc-alpha-(1->4)-GalNAc-alpha-(1->3)-diNAcBac-PP-undecaprenol alpha-1,4-N-acetyl-D-galactosaminyltransferase
MDEFSQLDSQTIEGQRIRRPLRLIFVARKFANMAGGLERISIDLMNEMARRGYKVGLMTWDESSAVTHYPLDPRVQWLKLDIGNPEVPSGMAERLARLRRFRDFVKKFGPDVILGFQSGAALFSRVATLGLGIKILAAERVSPDLWKHVRKGFGYQILDVYSLALADRITVQFPDYRHRYPRILWRKIVAIHNPVFHRITESHIHNVSGEKILLYVARLCFQKNHELLINAFAQLSSSSHNWKLVLAGDGEYDDRVRDQVTRMGLQDRVVFCGAVRDVDLWYRRAELVAFPSYFEGFPNALAEALAWGIPCVGLRDTLGVNSLIEDNINGLLVDATPEAFARGLGSLMGDPDKRRRMSVAARTISSKYAPENSYELWDLLLREMSSC